VEGGKKKAADYFEENWPQEMGLFLR